MFKIQNPKSKKRKTGFTLVEMLVAITVFTVTIVAISDSIVSAVKQQSRVLTSQEILDQTSYSLEYMGRALRMAKKELSAPDCLSQNGRNYEIPAVYQDGNENLGHGIRFINHLQADDCQEFFLENGYLKFKTKIGTVDEGTVDLTSSKLKVNSFRIQLYGKDQGDSIQPRAILFLNMRPISADEPEINIQTTISQRQLDVTY